MFNFFISLDKDGNYGIDRVLNLYDLNFLKYVYQFDVEESEVMLRNIKIRVIVFKMMLNGEFVVWLNIREGLVKVGNVKEKVVQSVFLVYSIFISVSVFIRGLIIVGCEDGRIMLLQVSDYFMDIKDRFVLLVNNIIDRLVNFFKDVYKNLGFNKIIKRLNKEFKVCIIIQVGDLFCGRVFFYF